MHIKRKCSKNKMPILEDETNMNVFVDEDYMLFEAVKWGKEDKVRSLILAGCHRNRKDENGRSALHWAAESGYIQIVYLLIDSAWDINALDGKNQTSLHIACNHRREDVASCLINLGGDVNVFDVTANTPLLRAVHMNLETIACMLCKAGANVNVRNNLHWTPLHEATRIGNENLVRMLLQHCADVNAVTLNGMTPFLTAIFYYRIAQRNTYSNLDDILKMLVEAKCRLSQSDGMWAPLAASIAIDNSFIAALLIYNGCLFEKRNKYSRSLLVDAFTRCEPFVTKLLVMAGYQVSLDETDQCSRRIPAFSKSFLRLPQPFSDTNRGRYELLQWLRQQSKGPKSLKEICRTSVRTTANRASCDTSILDKIYRLPLPDCLKNFLAMSDFISGSIR